MAQQMLTRAETEVVKGLHRLTPACAAALVTYSQYKVLVDDVSWVLDFAIPAFKFAIEVDQDPDNAARQRMADKMIALARGGWKVWSIEVEKVTPHIAVDALWSDVMKHAKIKTVAERIDNWKAMAM